MIGYHALQFNGDGDYVRVADSPSISVTGNITLSAWIRLDSNDPEGASNNIIAKDTNSSYRWRVNGDGSLWFLINDGGGHETFKPSASISRDTVYHHAVRADFDTNEVTWFVDGDSVETMSITDSSGIADSSGSLLIGTYDGTNEYWHGVLDDIRIYPAALSDSSILSISNGNDPGADPVAHWTFNDGSGSQAADKSKHENSGTLYGPPRWIGPLTYPGAIGELARAGEARVGEFGVGQDVIKRGSDISGSGGINNDRTKSSVRYPVTHGSGFITASRSISKARDSDAGGYGAIDDSRTVSKPRPSAVHGGGAVDNTISFRETFPEELTRDLSWDYVQDREGFLSEWVYRDANDDHGTVSLYLSGRLHNVEMSAPLVTVEFDKTGNGKPDTVSQAKPIYDVEQPVSYPGLRGDSGYYRILIEDLRPRDRLRGVMFGPSHT